MGHRRRVCQFWSEVQCGILRPGVGFASEEQVILRKNVSVLSKRRGNGHTFLNRFARLHNHWTLFQLISSWRADCTTIPPIVATGYRSRLRQPSGLDELSAERGEAQVCDCGCFRHWQAWKSGQQSHQVCCFGFLSLSRDRARDGLEKAIGPP